MKDKDKELDKNNKLHGYVGKKLSKDYKPDRTQEEEEQVVLRRQEIEKLAGKMEDRYFEYLGPEHAPNFKQFVRELVEDTISIMENGGASLELRNGLGANSWNGGISFDTRGVPKKETRGGNKKSNRRGSKKSKETRGRKPLTIEERRVRNTERALTRALSQKLIEQNMKQMNTLLPENISPELHTACIVSPVYWGLHGDRVPTANAMEERTDFYFNTCVEKKFVPTWEEYCLAIGWMRDDVMAWINGSMKPPEPAMAQIAKKVKEVLATYDVKLMMSGKLNVVGYIFRSKNLYDMSDRQEVEVVRKDEIDTATVDKDDLQKRYIDATFTVND